MTKLAKSDKIRSEIQECIPVGCVPPAAVAIGGGGLGVSTRPLLWPFGVVALLWPSAPPHPQRPYQKATFNQKATKPEGHNRRPHPPPQEQTPHHQAPPPQTCCKACWDITCNACWDSIPPWTESQTPVKTLPCPNFVAGGNKAVHRWLKTYASNQLLRRPLSSIWPRHHTQCRGRHAEYRRRSSVLCRTEFLKSSKHMR